MTRPSASSAFPQDIEFQKLLARQEDIDLTVAALELARDAQPELDFTSTLNWIDDRVEELSPQITRSQNERDSLQILAECLAGQHGLQGDESCFQRAEASYLNHVITSGRGLPISLSLVYLAVGERVGLSMFGVSAPYHFLVRCETASGPIFLDAYFGGRLMSSDDCIEKICQYGELTPEQASQKLGPASAREIIVRMLNNLKMLFARRKEWEAAWKVQERLTALQPASYHQRRDRALLALRSERNGLATTLLQQCLQDGPSEENEVLETQLRQAYSNLARWN